MASEEARDPDLSERAQLWASTMAGHDAGDVVTAHADSAAQVGQVSLAQREAREEAEAATLAPGATRAVGAGDRAVDEAPDPWRTCFERDRDRIVHSNAFRRLAGKTQVFVDPYDHQRTRLTHALEVAQVAVSIARACRLNVALTDAIALGHDCGHGPFGHASEDALGEFVDDGYNHALWGADVVLPKLNLCAQTLDGIRHHSWSLPAPLTPEGEVVSWADRIAYVCHDFEDAVSADVVTADDLPDEVAEVCGRSRREQLHAFIAAVVNTTAATGTVGMDPVHASALAAFRTFNYENIYLRPASVEQGRVVHRLITALVDWYRSDPSRLVDAGRSVDGDPALEAVTFVGGMTDRYALDRARQHLGWSDDVLPIGISG